MGTGAITSYVDVAQLVLYAFWLFFFGLVYWLIAEGHREGYPMDTDRGIIEGWPRAPKPKLYRLESGREVWVPRDEGPMLPIAAEPLWGAASAPYEPVGDPMLAGVGPGAWTPRPDEADLDHHGHPKITPLSKAAGFDVSDKDPDPRGMELRDANGDVAGVVKDLWVDQGEMQFRYLEAEVAATGGGTRRVLVPMAFARVRKDGVVVNALLAQHFANVPPVKADDRVTLLEEEKICAYYGAGTLYADPRRAEPLI